MRATQKFNGKRLFKHIHPLPITSTCFISHQLRCSILYRLELTDSETISNANTAN